MRSGAPITDQRQPELSWIQGLFCVWLLLLSFLVPYAGLDAFVPVLWKPIPPFGAVTPTASLIVGMLWVWRASLIACLLAPGRPLPLAIATALGFFCLGLRSCFGLQPQLFATLELSMVCLLAFAVVPAPRGQRGREVAFAIKLITVLLFFSAGLAKVRFGGVAWAFSGTIERSLRMLYPMNRDTLGIDSVLALRRALLARPALLRAGAVAAHVFELATPLALFSKRASRALLASTMLFIGANLLFFGVNFYTLVPMLVVWGLWDVTVQELALMKKPVVGFVIGALTFAQLGVTLLSGSNLWPLMLNDMYARPPAFPPVEAMDFALIGSDGTARELRDGEAFSPFSRFHVAIALLRQKGREERDALVARVLETCPSPLCDEAKGIIVNWQLEGEPSKELARYMRQE